MDDLTDVLGNLVGELKSIQPDLEQIIEQSSSKIFALDAQKLGGKAYAETQLPIAISLEAAKKLLIHLDNNLFYLETINILGLTRYVFELRIWLRAVQLHRLRSVEFFIQIYDDQQKHIERYIAQMESEADSFEALHMEDGLPADIVRLMTTDPSQLTASFVAEAIAEKQAEIDLKARRRFSLYRRAAVSNGYSFQAHLIRNKAIVRGKEQLKQILESRVEFVTRVTQPIVDTETLTRKGKRKKWNWREESEAVDLVDAYDFIYGYTSRLLHATPSSFYTTKKNLEAEEMETFLEFSYLSMLDLVEVANDLVGA